MAGPLSPEEWLKTQEQPKESGGVLSPEDWLASQQKGPVVLPDEDESSDFMRGFRNILPQIQETYGGAKVLAGKALDSKALIESGAETMKAAEAKQVVRESDEFTKAWEKGIGSVLTDWLPYQIGAGAGNLLETLGFAGLGAAGGAGVPGAIAGTIGRATLKKEIRDKATEILKDQGEEAAQKYIQKEAKKAVIGLGTTAGLAAQAGFHGAGEVTSRAVQETVERGGRPEDIDMTTVVPGAAVHAVADFVANKIMLGAIKPVDKKAIGSFAGEVSKRIAVTGLKEIPAEEIQTMAERYGAKLDLADAEALKEYINTAAASMAMSVVPGGVGGVRTYMQGARDDQAQNKQQEIQNRETFTGIEKSPEDPAGEIDAETEALLKPVIGPDGNPLAATATSVQAPDQSTAAAPKDPNATPAQPPAATPATSPELDAMRAEYAKREAEIQAGGPKPKIEAQTRKNAQLAEKIKAKEAELAQQAAAPTPGPLFTEEELTGEAPPVITPAPAPATTPTSEPAATTPEPTPTPEATAPTPTPAPAAPVTGIKTKRAKGRSAEEISGLGFLEQPSYFGQRAPADVDEGIVYAGREEGYDLFDSVDYKGGVEPEIKRIATEINAARKAKKQEITDRLKAEGRSPKEIKEALTQVKNLGEVDEGRPLDFMSEEDLVNIYRKYIGKKDIGRNPKDTEIRKAYAGVRGKFIDGLAPMQKLGIETNKEAAFVKEVIATELRGEKRTRRRMTEAEKAAQDIKRQLAEEVKTDEQIAAEEQAFEEAAIRGQEAKTEREAKKAAAKPETRRQLLRDIEEAVNEGGDVIDVLSQIANDKTNDSVTRAVARAVAKTLKDLGLIGDVSAKIVFGDVKGKNDGQFDPANNLITIQGKDGKYNGYRKIDQVMLHEIMHYLTDHVIGNRKAYLASITDAAKRKSVEMALNRLDNNYRQIKAKFGKKYKIGTMKEFIAEMYSNPALQVDVAMMPSDKPQTSMFRRVVENIAQALGFRGGDEAVGFKQIMDDIAEIISLPTAEIRGKSVSYSAAPQQPKKAEEPKMRENDLYDNKGYELPPEQRPRTYRFFKNFFTGVPAWRAVAQKFQNDRYPIKRWEDVLDMAGKIFYEGLDKLNNVYTQITLSTSRAKNFYNAYVKPLHEKLDRDFGRLAKETGMSSEESLGFMHRLLEALHEPERRRVKFLMTVPLSTNKTLGNGTVSPADRRAQIIKLLDTKKLSPSQALQLRTELDAIVDAKKPDGTPMYLDAFGDSPRATTKKDGTKVALPLDMNNSLYNVIGIEQDTVATRKDQYDKHPQKEIIDEILKDLKDLNDVTKDLSKYANYWSDFVTNRVGFYNFQHYAPFKGKASFDKHSEIDELLDFDSIKMGRELQDVAFSFDGRTTVSDNPVLQTISDAIRSTMRAGRKELTLSVKNAINQKLIKGKIKETIKFEERDSDKLKKYKGETTIFHYNDDGSIDILMIEDPKLRDAIRRTYKDTNPFTEMANQVTSFLGKMHTRWNYNFAPLNFVRDAITNAWAIGAEMGPAAAVRFAGEISSKVVMQNALPKAAKVARLYEKGDFTQLNALAAKDPAIKDMVEFIQEGGLVSYLQGLSLKSNFQELQKEIGRSGVIKNVAQLNKFLDIWVEMFELASRSTSYSIAKKNALAKGATEAEARTRAATYAKNLANFEQVGEWGKTMGAFFMFFRPAATGAVRAIEAAAPAFRNLDDVVNELPDTVKGDTQALAKFKEEYAFKQKSARVMISSLVGLGMVTYAMAAMMAPDDDLGRNEVMNDNMEQWTRFARFHIPKEMFGGKEDQVIQIPWGFGLGAFAAAGAQIASVAGGKLSLNDALANVFLQISLDSFVPIPVSRMKPADNPLAFFIDSITPSAARPLVEFLINKNGLGQDIYNDANRRMGDAYLGGDKIPEIWKQISAYLAEATYGAIDVSPNSLYFLSNSYIDGVGRVFELGYGISDISQGRKEFTAKTDLPLFGSFFGAKSSIDTREFAAVEKKIKEMERRINMFEANPLTDLKYDTKYPMDKVIVDKYNEDVADSLKDLQTEAKEIRLDRSLRPIDRDALLKINKMQQNLIKYQLIQDYKAYGVTP